MLEHGTGPQVEVSEASWRDGQNKKEMNNFSFGTPGINQPSRVYPDRQRS